ncbi:MULTISPECIES: glycoside hydrolase family 3 protein [unclassified Leclercia]|uniref:Glycoside hydrolase family 3 protein n=1 Tax=Leclercia barmai TaxID=2785629 RepID=A0ABS7RZN6_9ENTR|nr:MULTISPECIES: glycoside hydrolase family 3 C-terminal domain-containing protein [unclassified Leclercia]MBZ0059512.1 glycoside hydrolase family 3 protein [Leclercia sp. EMC7]MCM5697356.1 glycoside hydrolase family 3 C-terminal domain-containing protein [Leclercia sp. LTM01]MCM5702049.1 glycoside hydrolase family 3 C-terminal domain-containing protein [Leclercia sp. LTM14]
MPSFNIPHDRDKKLPLTAGMGMWSTHPIPDTPLGSVTLSDGPMGLTGGRVDERDIALLSPCGLALGASWDRVLVRRVGDVIGQEAQRTGVQALLAPNLNLMRSPMAGRAFELFGEDPRHIAEMGAAWIDGVQSRGVGCVVKHMVCNDSETDRRTMNVVVDEVTLREVYFWPFERAASQGVWGMLTAYNRVNGIYCAEQHQAISQWLKADLGWDGLVMSDWFGTQSGIASFRAGLDLEMPGPARHMGDKLRELLDENDTARLDDAVARLSRFAERVSIPSRYDPAPQAQRQRTQVLEEAAAAGFVLLKNRDNLLPLKPASRLAVIGPNAQTPCFQGGTFARVALMPDLITPIAALHQRFAHEGVEVEYAQGVESDYRIPPLTALALRCDDDEPGLEVIYATSRQGECHRERRNASSLIWFRDMPGVGDLLALDDEATVTVRTRFIATRTGVYRFWLGGTGTISLTLNGDTVAHFNGEALDGDIMGKLMQAASDTVEYELVEGVTLNLTLEMTLSRSIAHGIWFGCQQPQTVDLLAEAVACARRADSVVMVIGETADAGLESIDRHTTALPDHQVALINAVCAANPRTVVVLNIAHPVDTHCLEQAAAVMVAWYPGQEFGPALASVLAGDREPGGRLPVTFAREETDYPVIDLTPDSHGNLTYHEGLRVGYRYFAARECAPAWAFGYGIGYADITFGETLLHQAEGARLSVAFSLYNASPRAGKAVVQIYLCPPAATGDAPLLTLADFAAVTVAAGQSATVSVPLDDRLFRRWHPDKQAWERQTGHWKILTGSASDTITASFAVQVTETGVLITG